VSLPSNGRCNGEIVIIPHVDKCESLPTQYRWFVNITNVLLTNPDAVAVLISRDSYFTQRSITKHQCFSGKSVPKSELDTANRIIKDALNKFPTRVILVSYELLSTFPETEWGRVEKFLGLERHGKYIPFKNGNI
jgi:hypothetical protein